MPDRRRKTLPKELKKVIANATVRLTERCGQGVLVSGGFVLTAAHCIVWNGDGGMALGDYHPTQIETPSRASFAMEVTAAEPRADIAVLSALDAQEVPEQYEAFENWCMATRPVQVRTEGIARGTAIHVHILSHDGAWIDGTASRFGGGATGTVFFGQPIRSGTSGGPVVDDAGRLVGLVSNSHGAPDGSANGSIPLVHLALPTWVVTQIVEAQATA